MRDVWPLVPIVALLGGAWAAQSADLTAVAAALALLLGGWRPFWRVLTRTDWATPLARWRHWERKLALPRWPYLQPETPGAALHHTLEQARSWWHEVGREPLALPLRRAALALVVSLLMGIVGGRYALLLTLCLVSLAEIAALWHAGRGRVGIGWQAAAGVGLPWLLGASLGGSPSLRQALAALTLTVFVALFAAPKPWAVGGPLVGALFLISLGHFSVAGMLVLLTLPGLHLLFHRPPPAVYRRAVAPWILAALMLVAAAL